MVTTHNMFYCISFMVSSLVWTRLLTQVVETGEVIDMLLLELISKQRIVAKVVVSCCFHHYSRVSRGLTKYKQTHLSVSDLGQSSR